MKVEVDMTNSEERFIVNSWWATCPDSVLRILSDQIVAASAIWPELKKYQIGTIAPSSTSPQESASE